MPHLASPRWTLAPVLPLILAELCDAARPQTKPDFIRSTETDEFAEQFSHLHVHPSTHRSMLRRSADTEPPMLAVTFALHSTAKTLVFVMPPGYEAVLDPALPTSCGIYAPPSQEKYTAYSKATGAKPLPEHITECELKRLRKGGHVEVILHLCEGVHGLSELQSVQIEPGQVVKKGISWWFFHIQVWLPDVNPAKEDNVFQLHWSKARNSEWAGSLEQSGEAVLGDWDCVYSEWESWDSCSAHCGGGKLKLRRRILIEPPPGGVGLNCTEQLEMMVPCNTHDCLWPCEYTKEFVGECTAECGGGVRLTRLRWTGQHCPHVRDDGALSREACNTQPCRSRCRLDDKWTVVTECSELCGPGFYWLMRKVVAKDKADSACEPEWRRLPCLRQRCTPLTVLRPDKNMFPIAGDVFKAVLLFKVPVLARVIQVNAPEGFKFGNIGDTCNVSEHSLDPYFDHCEVGVRESQAVLHLFTPLPPTMQGSANADLLQFVNGESASLEPEDFEDMHELAIRVVSPECRDGFWKPDSMMTVMTCNIPPDENRWVIEFGEEGTTRWQSESTEGYSIFALDVTAQAAEEGDVDKDEKEEAAAKDEDADEDENEEEGEAKAELGAGPSKSLRKREPRTEFCSPRIPCEDGSGCDSNGLCKSSRQQRGLACEKAALP